MESTAECQLIVQRAGLKKRIRRRREQLDRLPVEKWVAGSAYLPHRQLGSRPLWLKVEPIHVSRQERQLLAATKNPLFRIGASYTMKTGGLAELSLVDSKGKFD